MCCPLDRRRWRVAEPRPGFEETDAPVTPRVVPIIGRVSNAFLLTGQRSVLVDAGAPGEIESLLAGLHDNGVSPGDLSLLVMSHGHADHAGAAKVLADAGVPIMIGAPDAHLLQRGTVRDLPVTGPAGAALRPFIRRMRAQPVNPQIQITGPTDLMEYGVDATVVPVAGHTPGSSVVVLANGDAIVGDLLRAGFGLGRVRSGYPLRHYFAEDDHGVRRGLQQVLDRDPTRLYVGHGGPVVDAAEVRRRLDAIAPTPSRSPHA
jgi:hydroxyacylglutathione hydrolase